MKANNAVVIIAQSINPKPEDHEQEVAWILARYFQCTIEFLQPSGAYKQKTPDIVMMGLMWEIKSPTGKSKQYTIQDQFKGLKQSRNLVIDGRRTTLADDFIVQQIERETAKHTRVGRILFVDKNGKVVELN